MARRRRGRNHSPDVLDTHGFSIHYPKASLQRGWEAAYGLELIRITKEANELGEAEGRWIEPYYPTEEEFLAARKEAKMDPFNTKAAGATNLMAIRHLPAVQRRRKT